MRLRFLDSIYAYRWGGTYEVPERAAREFIRTGVAVPAEPETAAPDPELETTDLPAARPRKRGK